jgi:hypothetical protein
MPTSVDKIKERIAKANGKVWKYSEGHLVTTYMGEQVPLGSIALASTDDRDLITHSREDLEYLVDLLDAQLEAMAEARAEAEHWKLMAVGGQELAKITTDKVLCALLEERGGEAFIPDDLMDYVKNGRVIFMRDRARGGVVYTNAVAPDEVPA